MTKKSIAIIALISLFVIVFLLFSIHFRWIARDSRPDYLLETAKIYQIYCCKELNGYYCSSFRTIKGNELCLRYFEILSENNIHIITEKDDIVMVYKEGCYFWQVSKNNDWKLQKGIIINKKRKIITSPYSMLFYRIVYFYECI